MAGIYGLCNGCGDGENRSSPQRFNELIGALSGAVQGAESGTKVLRWLGFVVRWGASCHEGWSGVKV